MRTAAKQKSRGPNAQLKESLRYLFHFLDANSISFRNKSIISAPTTEGQ